MVRTTRYGQNQALKQGIQLYKILPENIKSLTQINEFKNKSKEYIKTIYYKHRCKKKQYFSLNYIYEYIF